MLNYRRLIAFSSRVHTYVTSLYVAFFFLFLLFLHLDVSQAFYSFLVSLSSAIGWIIVLEGAYVIIASIHISIASRVMAFEPFFLTILRLALYLILSFIFDFIVRLNSFGLEIGVSL